MRLSDDAPFFQVPRTAHTTSVGAVELPILYYDVSNVLALFRVAAGPVRELLSGTGLTPVEGFGSALLALSFYDYRRTTVGPYREVGVATFVQRPGAARPRWPLLELYGDLDKRTVGATVLDLPVTTEIARAAGRELWGFPKFVTEISFHLESRRFESTVSDPVDRAAIVTLSGRLGRALPAPPMSLLLFSQRDQTRLASHVHVRGLSWAHAPGKSVLRVGSSRHPMAQRLRQLGVDGKTPSLVLSTHAFQSRLHAGVSYMESAATDPMPRQRVA